MYILIPLFFQLSESHKWQDRNLDNPVLRHAPHPVKHSQGFYKDGTSSGYFRDGQFRRDIGHTEQEYKKGTANQFRTLRQIFQTKDDNHARNRLHQDKFMRKRRHHRTNQHSNQVGKQSCPRVEKSPNHNRNDSIREYVDIKQPVRDAKLRQEATHEYAAQQEDSSEKCLHKFRSMERLKNTMIVSDSAS